MANTLRFKRGLVSGIPTAALGEPLFTTDTFDLYIGNGTGNTRFQKYIASGTTSQLLRGDGSLLTMPIVLTSPSNGQVLKYDGTNWVNSADAGVTGSGANGQVTFWNSASTITGSNNLFWNAANNRLGINTNAPSYTADIRSAAGTVLSLSGGSSTNQGAALYITNSAFTGTLTAFGDSANILGGTPDASATIFTGSSIPLHFYINGGQAARISTSRNFIINNASTDNGLRFQVTGTGYFSDSVGIGSTTLTGHNLRVSKTITGGATAHGIYQDGTVQLDVTSTAYGFRNIINTVNSLSVGIYNHFYAQQGTIGTSNTITEQSGFFTANLTSGTFNFGFRGQVASGTNRWNLYMDGTANNYLAGSLGIGTSSIFAKLDVRVPVGGVVIRADANAADDINFYATGTVTGNISPFRALMSATGNVTQTLRNTNAATGGSQLDLIVNPLSTGDAYVSFSTIGGTMWSMGIDNSDSDKLKIGNIADPSTATPHMTMFVGGNTAIGSISDSGEKLQVTGTMKVTGAASIGSTTSISGTAYTLLALNNTNAVDWGTHISFAGNGTVFGYFGSVGSLLGNTTKDLTVYATAGNGFRVYTNGNNLRATIDTSGNLGLGVTPSAWISSYKPIQIGFGSAISGRTDNTQTMMFSNAYRASDGTHYYIRSSENATQYLMNLSGQHIWYNAPSGTAGNAITFTQAMTLDASGNLMVATTTASNSAAGRGNITIGGTSTSILNFQIGGTLVGYFYHDNNNLNLLNSKTGGSLLFSTESAERARVFANGNFSIGSSTDSGEKLQVTGTAKITGATSIINDTNAAAGLSILNPNTGTSAISRLNLGSANSNWFFDAVRIGGNLSIKNNISGSPVELLSITNGGNLAVDTNTLFVDATNNRVGVNMTPSYALDVTGSARISDAIAIGTTPDTNNPFKILKNINATVGIKFENTNTSSAAFSAVQLGTDITGATKFTNLVYSSAGVVATGVYNPDGTSLINNGSGGLNFLGTPFRIYTGTGNGTLRILFDNEGTTQFTATTPTTNATDGYKQYSADVTAGNAAPHFRTENGAVIKLYQETTGVGNAIFSQGGGNSVLDDSTFDGYTLRQIVKALRNQGILA